MNKPIIREEIAAASEAGEGPKLYVWSRVIELLDSHQSRLEEMEEQKEAAYRSREGWRRCALDAEARARELEAQLEAAKVEGFNEGIEAAVSVADKHGHARLNSPIKMGKRDQENMERMAAQCLLISVDLKMLLPTVADSKRGEE